MLADVIKTIGMGIIFFQFDPSIPLCAKTNFHLMGVWSIAAKPNWKDLFPIETEILGFSQGYKKLSYYVMGAPVIHGIVDHKPFVELYHRKDMDELSPRMLRLMHDILEQPFKMTWLDRKNDFILTVDAPPTHQHHSGFTHWGFLVSIQQRRVGVDFGGSQFDSTLQSCKKWWSVSAIVWHGRAQQCWKSGSILFHFFKDNFITFSWVDIISDYVLVIVLVEGGGGFLGLGILNPRIEDP